MASSKDRLVTAKYLSDWTLVRLPDGQVGVLTKQDGGCRDNLCHPKRRSRYPRTRELEVIKHPAELAMEALKTLPRRCKA